MDNPLLNYNESERTAYLTLLASVASADYENSEGEVAFMQQMCSMAQVGESGIQEVTNAMQNPSGVNFATHINALKNSELKFSLVADILNMVNADGDTDAEELAHIKRLNAALGINEEQFGVMDQYVQKANKFASEQEGIPGLGSLLGGSGGGGLGDLLGAATSFLTQSGMQNQFQQAGIPTNNFQSGSTIGTILGGLATNFLQSKLSGGAPSGGSGAGGMLGGLVGSVLGGATSGQSNSNSGGGLGGLLSGVLTSEAGQQAIGGLIGQMMGGQQQGSGLPNLGSLLGGGGKPAQQSGMGGLMDALLKGM